MNTTHIRKKLTASALGGAFVAAAAAVILAAPASADTPPDPCVNATSCLPIHMPVALTPLLPGIIHALNPQPLPPG